MSKLTDEQKIEIVEKYKTGKYTGVQLGKEYNVTFANIYNLLKKRNIPTKSSSDAHRKYTLNENYFDVIDTEDKAYFLGLLYADGCNDKERYKISIGLQERDKDILENFNKYINSNRPLMTLYLSKKNVNWQNSIVLSICSKHMSQQLSNLGCFARKSLTLKFPTEEQVPSHLIRHFVRGYFDGDGTIAETTKGVIINLISTEEFCKELKNFLHKNLEIETAIDIPQCAIDNDTSTRKLRIKGGKKSHIKFLSWLYDNSKLYLCRKYEKFINYKLI